MVSSNATLSPSSSYSSLFPFPNTNINTFSPKHLKLTNNNNNKNKNINSKNHSLQIQCFSALAFHSQTHHEKSHTLLTKAAFHEIAATIITTADKLKHLSSEFNSLSEPIDRVKRLLHYAAMLPPLEDSDRVPENRVVGCSTQVWVVSEMDEDGRMRFKADSDSEISKGFCWCLVWMLDGAEPKEVLMVKKEDLTNMNVGLNVKAQSRVNTWQNVLFAMQKATKDLVFDSRHHNANISALKDIKESIQKTVVAKWDSSNTKTLLDCCMAQNRKLGKPGVRYGSKSWEEICVEFNKCTNQDYTQKQLKNMMHTMRSNWSLWTQLVNKETGFGWNPQTRTIVADATWWDAKIMVNSSYKRFRKVGLEFHEELKFIFGDAMATSESAWTPTIGVPSESNGKNTPIDMTYNVDSDKDLNFNDDYSQVGNSQPTKKRKTPQGVGTKEVKGKTKFGTATTMRNRLDRLIAPAESHNEDENEEIEATSHVYGKYSIPECIEVLKSLMVEECLNDQQFSYSLELLKDEPNRVILISLKDSRDALVNWILYKYDS